MPSPEGPPLLPSLLPPLTPPSLRKPYEQGLYLPPFSITQPVTPPQWFNLLNRVLSPVTERVC